MKKIRISLLVVIALLLAKLAMEKTIRQAHKVP